MCFGTGHLRPTFGVAGNSSRGEKRERRKPTYKSHRKQDALNFVSEAWAAVTSAVAPEVCEGACTVFGSDWEESFDGLKNN